MDISVRYIPTQFTKREGDGKLVGFGNKPALCFVGATEARCVVNDDEGMHVVRLPPEMVNDSSAPAGYDDPQEGVPKFIQYFNVRLIKTAPKIADEVFDLIRMAQDPPDDFPEAGKPASPSKPRAKRSKAPATKKPPSIINQLAEEMKTTPPKIRKALRGAGLKAPYDDEKKIRAALKNANGTKK